MGGNHSILDTLMDYGEVSIPVPELLADIKGDDDIRRENAAHLLLVKFYKMVLKLVYTISGKTLVSDDFIQAGAVGIYEAAKRYDASRGIQFSTYAYYWIMKYVYMELRNEILPLHGIYVPETQKTRLYYFVGMRVSGKPKAEIMKELRIDCKTYTELSNLAKCNYYFEDLSTFAATDDDIAASREAESVHRDPAMRVESAENAYFESGYPGERVGSIIAKIENEKYREVAHLILEKGLTKQESASIMSIPLTDFRRLYRGTIRSLKVLVAAEQL